MQRHLRWLFLVVTVVVGLLLPRGHSEAVVIKHALQQLPVTGQLADGGTFTGRLTVHALNVNDLGQLAATGILTGTASPQAGGTTTIAPRTFTAPAPLLDLHGTCTTLVLEVEPIFLPPLGQQVTLVPITLELHPVPQQTQLLRTALCALARLQE
jgi:hypothetical protein